MHSKKLLIPTQLGALRHAVSNSWFSCSSRSSIKASIFLSENEPASIDSITAHSSGSNSYRLPCAPRRSTSPVKTPPKIILTSLHHVSRKSDMDEENLTALGS
jgi:hypothetical protein